jgi:hypothetical protein
VKTSRAAFSFEEGNAVRKQDELALHEKLPGLGGDSSKQQVVVVGGIRELVLLEKVRDVVVGAEHAQPRSFAAAATAAIWGPRGIHV